MLDSLLWKQEPNAVTNACAGGMVAAIADVQQEVESFDDEERPICLHWPPSCLLDESSSSSG